MFILTVRNDRLGDLILALPTLTALRESHPDARLGIVASDYAAPVLSIYPGDIEVWADTDESRTRLADDRPDVILFLYPDKAWAAAARNAKVERRIGTRYRLYSWQFNERIPVHRKSNRSHEAAYNLMIAEPLIGERLLTPPALHVDTATNTRARTLLVDHHIQPGDPYVVLHPGSKGSALDWPAAHFRQLAADLHADGLTVVVTGSESERAVCESIARPQGVSLAGATDIPLLAAVLQNAAVVVAGSTGPLHLAAAVNTPVVALFSPHHAHSPRRWGPLGDMHQILQPPVPNCRCKPGRCVLDGCMALLGPDAVAAAVNRVVRNAEARA